MSVLYNCHTDGDQYRITKFDDLGGVESTYLCTTTECECPAGSAPTCRHRKMLPEFLATDRVDSFWFYDYDRKGWVSNEPANTAETTVVSLDEPAELHNAIAEAVGEPAFRRRV